MLSSDLLDWYDRHARALPWRVTPERSKRGERADPYHVWLSEVMLQQTTVTAVKPYFERFRSLWPAVHDLAAAPADDVMREWAGLGYYARARNMHACAKVVVSDHDGRFPETEAGLRALPGIGDYTAAAIAAIAFGERALAVVDGNIERVTLRQLADATPLPKAKSIARTWMDDHVPATRPGDFVQAMMDLGATICTSKNPVCALCPISKPCLACAHTPTDYPVKAKKKTKPQRRGAAFVARKDDGVWTIRRPAKGMLGGMMALPSTDWSSKADGATGREAAPFPGTWSRAGEIEHGFTHFGLTLEVWVADDARPAGKGAWSQDTSGLPSLFAKVLEAAR